MDVEKIVADLKIERDRVSRAIEALEGNERKSSVAKVPASPKATSGKKRGGITPAGRKRLAEAMRKRWAERRKKA